VRKRSDEDLADIVPHDMTASNSSSATVTPQSHWTPTRTFFEGDLTEVMDRLDAHSATESRPQGVLGDVDNLPHTSQEPRNHRGLSGSGGGTRTHNLRINSLIRPGSLTWPFVQNRPLTWPFRRPARTAGNHPI